MRTDADLAAAFRDGDDQAFAILYERYKRVLFVFAVKMLGDSDSARDLVQDVFLRIYEKRHQLARPESFRSWLFAAGRNRCISRLRHTVERTSLDEISAEPAAADSAPDLEADEEIQMVRRALARIRPEYREVLILREYEDLSYREIAEATESTESAVKARLFKARKALHDALRPAVAGGR